MNVSAVAFQDEIILYLSSVVFFSLAENNSHMNLVVGYDFIHIA